MADLPLWKIWKSVGVTIPHIWKNQKCSKPGLFETMVACVPWRQQRLCCVTGINFSYSANSEQQEPTKSIQITKIRKWSVLVAVGQPELAYLFWAGRILDCQKPAKKGRGPRIALRALSRLDHWKITQFLVSPKQTVTRFCVVNKPSKKTNTPNHLDQVPPDYDNYFR